MNASESQLTDRPQAELAESEMDPALPHSPEPSEGEIAPELGRDVILIQRSHFFAMLLPLAFALGIGLGYLLWGTSEANEGGAASAGAPGNTASRAGRLDVSPDDDPALGPVDAPVTIIEFSDFNCPFCQRWHNEVFQELMQTYPEQIHFVYRDFPVVGGGAVGLGAAQAANCAGEQGAYWEYHDALFSGRHALDRSGFEQYAQETGLDAQALLTCLDSGRHEEEVSADLEYGAGLGITGTPTFFINGIPVVGAQPLLRFMQVINGELGQ